MRNERSSHRMTVTRPAGAANDGDAGAAEPATAECSATPKETSTTQVASEKPSCATEPAPRRSLLWWLSPFGMAHMAMRHPWTSVAMILSVAIPMIVAWFPAGDPSGTGEGAALDALPIPGRVEFHADATPIELGASTGPDMSEPGGSSFDPGSDGSDGTSAHRHAAFQDDIDAGQVQPVGANRPATNGTRGAWLTGVIEEAAPRRSTAPSYRETRSRRY